MTVFLSIIGALALLFLFAAFIRVYLIIEARENATVYMKILFIKLQLYPKKEKKLRVSDYSAKKLSKKAERARKKRASKQKKAKDGASENAPRQKKSFSELLDTASLVIELCRTFLSKFSKYLRLELSRVHINISGEDAAKTAIYYGAANSIACSIVAYLDETIHLSVPNERDIRINADFLSGHSSIDIRLLASLRIWQAASILFSLALKLAKEKIFANN